MVKYHDGDEILLIIANFVRSQGISCSTIVNSHGFHCINIEVPKTCSTDITIMKLDGNIYFISFWACDDNGHKASGIEHMKREKHMDTEVHEHLDLNDPEFFIKIVKFIKDLDVGL